MQQQTEDLHTCARCASPHPRAWCYPHRRGTTIKVHKVKIGVWTFSTKQTEREWRRQWADAVATTADLAGVHAPPHVVLTAARILRDRDRLAEASRARGREKTNRKYAERAARFEAEIADRLEPPRDLRRPVYWSPAPMAGASWLLKYAASNSAGGT
jgi:hypothetical protein